MWQQTRSSISGTAVCAAPMAAATCSKPATGPSTWRHPPPAESTHSCTHALRCPAIIAQSALSKACQTVLPHPPTQLPSATRRLTHPTSKHTPHPHPPTPAARTCRWLATFSRVRPSTFIRSRMRLGTALSMPSVFTAFTNCTTGGRARARSVVCRAAAGAQQGQRQQQWEQKQQREQPTGSPTAADTRPQRSCAGPGP